MNAPTAVAEQMKLVDIEPRPAALPAVQQQNMPANVVTPADLLRIAMESGDKDIERLERLMAMDERYRQMQERERQRQAALAFDEDFAKFTQLGIVIPKTKLVKQRAKNGGAGPTFWQSEYDQVCKLLKPALGQHGFGVHHAPEIKRNSNGKGVDWIDVTCTLTHRLGHSRSITLGGPPDDSGSKNPGQEIQSTITFWSRHTLLAITSTAQEGKDNDGRGARGYREEGGGEDGDPEQSPGEATEFDRLLAEGNERAQHGVKVLTEWWGKLSAKQRSLMNAEFGAMRKTASNVDRVAGRVE